MCQPSSSDDSLLKWEWLERASNYEINSDFIPGEINYMGVDAARKGDNTDIWILNKANGKYNTKYCESMNNTPYDDQVKRIGELMAKYNVKQVAIDGTGTVGAHLEARLQIIYGTYKIQAITFTNPIKEDMASAVHTACDRE